RGAGGRGGALRGAGGRGAAGGGGDEASLPSAGPPAAPRPGARGAGGAAARGLPLRRREGRAGRIPGEARAEVHGDMRRHAIFLCLLACAHAPQPIPISPLSALSGEFWELSLRRNPFLATSIGDRRYDAEVPDESP